MLVWDSPITHFLIRNKGEYICVLGRHILCGKNMAEGFCFVDGLGDVLWKDGMFFFCWRSMIATIWGLKGNEIHSGVLFSCWIRPLRRDRGEYICGQRRHNEHDKNRVGGVW